MYANLNAGAIRVEMEGVEHDPRKFLKHCQINWVCKWRLVHSCRHLPAPAWPGMRLDRSLAVRGKANRSQRASWRSDWHRATPQPTLANLIVAACQDKVELETNWPVSFQLQLYLNCVSRPAARNAQSARVVPENMVTLPRVNALS